MNQPIELSYPHTGAVISVRIDIIYCQVSIVVDGEWPEDLYTLRNSMRALTRTFVDAFGYIQGYAYDIELKQVWDSDGNSTVYGIDIPVLAADFKSRPVPPEMAIMLALNDHPLKRCFSDLRGAMREPDDTGFHCFRAVESLRHHWQAEGSKSNQWNAMRQALRLDQEYIGGLKEWADDQRHGAGLVPMTDQDRQTAFRLTWAIVDRYIILVRDELDALPESDFELLANNLDSRQTVPDESAHPL